MLTGLYITLRFGHFISLMLAFGCVLYGAWWAPVPLRRVLMLRFYPLLRRAAAGYHQCFRLDP